jgi:hypothetical protein
MNGDEPFRSIPFLVCFIKLLCYFILFIFWGRLYCVDRP